MQKQFSILALLIFAISLSAQRSQEEKWAKNIEVVNEKRINTENSEFSPTFWSDNLVYVKSNPRQKNQDKILNEGYFDLFFTRLEAGYLSKSSNLSTTINTNYHEGPATFANDGFKMIFTRVDYDGKEFTTNEDKVAVLKIFESEYTKGSWSAPQKSSLNIENIASCHPTLAPSGKYIIFASDRPEGFGKMDLYISYKTEDGWGSAINLGSEINSAGNDWFPQINERQFLFFASDGHSNNSDLDLYQCEIEGGAFSTIQKLPYPINTRFDDFGLCVDKLGTSGYLSSNRPGGSGKDDLYSFNSFETLYAYGNKNYNVIYVNVSDKKSKLPLSGAIIRTQPIDANDVQSFDKDIFELNSQINYDSIITDKQGNGKLSIKEGYSLLEISYSGKQAWKRVVSNQHSEKNIIAELQNIEAEIKQEPKVIYIEKEVSPEVINNVVVEEGSIIVFDNIYYDYNSYKLTRGAETELDALVGIMLNNPNLKIQLSAHTDSRGQTTYNLDLSQKRAESAREYLILNGVLPYNIVARGYGESQLRNHCKDDINCSEAEHIYNRRTEVKILQK